MRTLLALSCLLASGCGATTAPPAPPAVAAEVTPSGDTPSEAPSETSSDGWLASLSAEHVLTYRVSTDAGEHDVRMVVQQRIERGGSVAVRLAPIGTPLEETPVYPQWLIGSSDGLCALEEHAALTEPGFVPIDEAGRLLTEAASNEAWLVESRWMRAGLASGGEAAAGWALLERVPRIEQPIEAERCVRLEQREGSTRTTQLVCAGFGVVELERSEDDAVRERWQLVAIGPRAQELE